MKTFFALIASLGLVGCVGGLEPTGPTADPEEEGPGGGTVDGDAAAQAKKLYEDNVHPVATRLCIGCHNAAGPAGNVTGFVSSDLTNAYATAVGYQAVVGNWTPEGAPILTKITVNPTASHQGIAYSNDELNKITEWLNKELEARGAPGPNDPQGPESVGALTQRLLAEWTGCMTLQNFEAADLRAMGNVNANNNGGQCKTCHALGEYGFIASNTSNPNFFPTITEDKYFLLQYFAVDLSGGVANAKIIVNDRSFQGVAQQLAPHQAHPSFNATNNNGYQALTQFYNTTMAARNAAPNGVCGPSKLLN